MNTHSLRELSALLTQGEISSEELTRHYLERSQTHNPALNCYISLFAEQALQQARQADALLKKKQAGPLTGIPIAHKDIFCTLDQKTSCGSRMLDNFNAPYDATVVEKLNAAGTITLGKTNMDEFAMGSSSETSYYGPVLNPWDQTRVPGGSSGGSAAAVAARLIPAATATDTGGSIRQPAAFCGVTGIKPTYGRVSRYGMIAFASSLDQGGAITQSAEDAALMLAAMAGFDERDSTSVERPADDYLQDLNKDIKGIKIGLPAEYFNDNNDAAVSTALDVALTELQNAGAELVEIGLPNTRLSIPAYYVIAPAECSANLARYDGVRFGHRCADPTDLEDLYYRSRSEGFGAEVQRRIMTGTYVLSSGYYDAYYLKAQQIRRLIRDDFINAFKQVDVIVGPTSPTTAFALNAHQGDPVAMYLADIYTAAVNLAGLPAVSVPTGFGAGLPVGMQFIGKHFAEAQILNIAHRYQQATDWHRRIPVEFA
ncbi:MAG: Asp-tRNA(Asn)/Glu-tRNA(Gln) amidotransferase subunit GatA [Gammaproteobacteria bacterium]